MKRLIPFLVVFSTSIACASSDVPFVAHCNTCDVAIVFYTQRIDKHVFDLSARLKSLSASYGNKRVNYTFVLIRVKDVPPYDVRFYQNVPWPNGLEVSMGTTKQAKDRGIEELPSAFVRFGSDTAVVPAVQLDEVLDRLDVLMK